MILIVKLRKGVIVLGVVVRDNESVDDAIKRFKKVYAASGVQSRIRKEEFYQKPSDLKRLAKAERIRKMRKNLRKKQLRRPYTNRND